MQSAVRHILCRILSPVWHMPAGITQDGGNDRLCGGAGRYRNQRAGGSLSFLAVPAEEYIDADKRVRLQKEGTEFCCGKNEMIRTGVFDDTDIVLTTHVHMVPVEEDFTWEIRRATVTVLNVLLSGVKRHMEPLIRGME